MSKKINFYDFLALISVGNVEVRDVETDELIAYSRTQTSQAIDITSDQKEIQGGFLNVTQLTYSVNSACAIETTDCQFNVPFIARKLGTSLTEGIFTFAEEENLTVDETGAITLSKIPAGTKVTVSNDYGYEEVTITEGQVNIGVPNFEKGETLKASYLVAKLGFDMEIKANAIPKNVKIIINEQGRDKFNNTVRIKKVFPNCSLEFSQNISLAADGNTETGFNAKSQEANGAFGHIYIEKLDKLGSNLASIAVVPSTLNMKVGDTTKLKVKGFGNGMISNVNVDASEFTFTASDDTKITVAEDGTVTAVGEVADATITIANKKDASVTASVVVNIVTA